MERSRLTQEIANAFPLESAIRANDQSQGFTLLNTLALQQEEILRQVKEIGDSYYLTTANLNTIGNLWIYDLGTNFAFADDPNNSAFSFLRIPTVSGVTTSGTIVDVDVVTDNSLQALQLAPPDRFTLYLATSGVNTLWSGFGKDTYNTTIESPVHPSNLNITLVSGENYLRLDPGGEVRRGRLQINGTSFSDIESSEAVVFLHDDKRPTLKLWKNIDSIAALDLLPDTIFITIKDNDFNNPPYRDIWNWEQNNQRELTDTFWTLENTGTGYTSLSKQGYAIKGLTDRITGLDLTLETVQQNALLTSSGVALAPLDLAFKPYTNLVYIVDKSTIYVYDDKITLPSGAKLSKARETPNRLAIIEASTHWAKHGEEVNLDLYFARPINAIIKHKLLIEYPDGKASGINNGVLYTPTDKAVWVPGDPVNRRLRPTETLVLNQFGEYVFTLETHYRDNTKDWDQVIISVPSKKPLVETSVHQLLKPNTTISGIDFDTLTLKPRLLGNDGTRYLLNEHKDLMLVDFSNKQLYFHEDYDSVRVIS